jgi:RHH-type proline utilization regulon transcriptional repressor/proline dehydrogenase/delta 1-pyrroline-5-carboxylate dehydrogenase
MDLQKDIENKGLQIFQNISTEGIGLFNKDWWYGKVMEWSMRNEHFKTQMFRFVDVLPYLNKSSDIAKHLKEYFAESGDKMPSIFNFGAGIGALAPGLLAGTVKKNVTQMAKMFIVGEDSKSAFDGLDKLRKTNITFTADLLGEACLNEKEALEYQSRYIELLQGLHQLSEKWEHNALIDENHLGQIPKVNVSVKLSALYSQIKVEAWEASKQALKERLRPILQIAKERNIFINMDLEQYALKQLTFEVFKELVMEPELIDYPHFGLVIQAYLRDSLQDSQDFIQFAKQRKAPITVRLVKGAYWDYETVESEQRRWPYPVYTNKAECDANYEACSKILLDNYKHIHLAIASHNVRSISAAIVHAEKNNIPKNSFEIQMLFGMADAFKKSLSSMGYRVRVYAPIGELIPGMAYLVRRLLENTSNESFLRSKFAEGESSEKLLRDPATYMQKSPAHPANKAVFYNEAFLDFGFSHVRQKMKDALQKSKTQYQKPFPIVINNKNVTTERQIKSLNPSNPEEVVGSVYVASTVEADEAVKQAHAFWPKWRKTPTEERCQLLEKLANKMVERRYELSALMVREVGKSWKEADGDVCEAIDFCRYYARDMRRIDIARRMGQAPGEVSLYHYQSRGVCAVIAPWNFPLAILAGMVVGAAVTGNTVVMKPAEQSSIIAAVLMEMIGQVGFPAGVVQFLPGYGEEIGEFIVNHTLVSTIAFTGSKEVGLKIVESAGKTLPGQRSVKRCLIEMGGKNAIVIDSDADLDEAINGVLYSAFGFQGQKCSACSRVIVVEEIYERFIERIVESMKNIKVTASEDPSGYMGPVISEEAKKKIMSMIDLGKGEGKLAFQGNIPDKGYFVPPTLFTDIAPNAQIAQQEIFGPVLAVIRAKTFEEAIDIANNTEYALTGAVYSRSPANIEYAKETFEAGNLYINRGSTAALVDRHPFGGFKMSGVGSKTGGPDYLQQFMDPKLVVENTLRRGFAPSEQVVDAMDGF